MADDAPSPQNNRGRRQFSTKRTKLKGSQLERKRKVDREAQAALRNRTKNRIAHLESLVKALGGSDRRDEQLVSQLNDNREHIESLVETLSSIRKLVNSALELSSSKTTSNDSSASPTCSPGSGSGHAPILFLENKHTSSQPPLMDDAAVELLGSSIDDSLHEAATNTFEPDETLDYNDPTALSESLQFNEFPAHNTINVTNSFHFDSMHGGSAPSSADASQSLLDLLQQESSLARVSSTLVQQSRTEGTLWYLVDALMNAAINSSPSQIFNQDSENEDIPIRAVLNGWPVVEELYTLDAGWKMLRQIDQTVYAHCGALERLAILRMMRLTFDAQVKPRFVPQYIPQFPKFMFARPSEKHIAHQRIVEYFVWPGLREHIVFSPTKYATNRFMDAFRNGFRFMWSHDLSDAFVKNKQTGLYTFTPRFVEGQSFLRCWTMNADFFRLFPELKSDMPVSDISRSLTGCHLLLPFSDGPEECLDDTGNDECAESVIQGAQSEDTLQMDWGQHSVFWQSKAANTASFPTQMLGAF